MGPGLVPGHEAGLQRQPYPLAMSDADIGLPEANLDDRDLLLAWLRFLRGAVLRNAEGLTDEQADWTPDGRLICLKGIVNHLTRVEWRWIDGGMLGQEVDRSEAEFSPGGALPIDQVVDAYRHRAEATDATVRSLRSLTEPCRGWGGAGRDLRWVLLHLINETARHAGHADATRELLDGRTGE